MKNYNLVFKNRMATLGLTLEKFGQLLSVAKGNDKPYPKQRIHTCLQKKDNSWKAEELKVWCKILKLDYLKLIGDDNENRQG